VNIKGGVVYPVAEELLARMVPVLFSTGYTPDTLPLVFRDLRCQADIRRKCRTVNNHPGSGPGAARAGCKVQL
jgi:hypothetical protein